MKTKVTKRKVFCFIGIPVFVFGGLFYLFFDAFYGGYFFRTLQDQIPAHEKVDRTGLNLIKASGGTMPRFFDLKRLLYHVKDPIIIVDVKCEKHGYVRGVPTVFFGYGVPNHGIKHLLRRLLWTGTSQECEDLVVSEEEEASKFGYGYKSVNIGSKFTAADKNIDDIVDFLNAVPKETWLHVHCTRGRGRTSMILAMLDIMRNAPQVSLIDIIKRQHLLGSVDLFNTEVWKNGTYYKKQLETRKKFIIDFYDFVCQRKVGGIQKWSEWNKQKTMHTE